MAKTPEGEIVAYGRKRLTEKGCLVRKISYEMRRGCPDHLVLMPAVIDGGIYLPAKVLFIEYKRDEDTQPEEHQLREHERIRQHGGDVRVIGSKSQVDRLVREFFG
ncbi:VRR-NUC domain-containing protein [Salmonella enterica subsp. enterica serovar Rubislaw]|nr:VRR-NUC domain-containing protein [Salmonella enterica subsp. enterica serovar Rubislaw]